LSSASAAVDEDQDEPTSLPSSISTTSNNKADRADEPSSKQPLKSSASTASSDTPNNKNSSRRTAVAKTQSLRSRAREAWAQQQQQKNDGGSHKGENKVIAAQQAASRSPILGKHQPRATSLMAGMLGARDNVFRSSVSFFFFEDFILKRE
jgi:hypothetical protein